MQLAPRQRGAMMAEGRYPRRVPIEAYGNGGFRFAGMSHRGSILCLPSGMLAWNVAGPDGLDEALVDVLDKEGTLPGLLIIGTGRVRIPLPAKLVAGLDGLGLLREVMDTGAAARTYNILLGEGRDVGAALVAVE